MTIRELSSNAYQLINASYQLDSPVQIAKELLDNSIDAGATEIEIQIASNRVSCQDNGKGFSEELLAKLFNDRVTTKEGGKFGFRGEALYMINKLAKVRVESRGLKLEGTISVTNIYATLITVTDIFYNIPVRRYYFEQAINFYQVIRQRMQLFEAYAIAFPIYLKIVVAGQVRFNTFGKETRLQRFQAIFNDEFKSYIEIQGENNNFSFSGFLSSQNNVTRQQHLFVFVNDQFVLNYEFYQAICDVYKHHNAIYKVSGYMFVKVPANRVDFNCSSDKLTAKLMGVQYVIQLIKEKYEGCLTAEYSRSAHYITQLLGQDSKPLRSAYDTASPIRFKAISFGSSGLKQPGITLPRNYATKQAVPPSAAVGAIKERTKQPYSNYAISSCEPLQKPGAQYDFSYIESSSSTENEEEAANQSDSLFDCKYIGQYNKSFLLVSRHYYLFLIDQHALDEAVNYERLCEKEIGNNAMQPLLKPARLNLSPHQLQLLMSRPTSFYEGFGFGLDRENVLLKAVPVVDGFPMTLQDFVAFVDDLENDAAIPTVFKTKLANRACKSAVKLGDSMTPSQATQLLERARNSSNVMNCPHGRKVIFRLY